MKVIVNLMPENSRKQGQTFRWDWLINNMSLKEFVYLDSWGKYAHDKMRNGGCYRPDLPMLDLTNGSVYNQHINIGGF